MWSRGQEGVMGGRGGEGASAGSVGCRKAARERAATEAAVPTPWEPAGQGVGKGREERGSQLAAGRDAWRACHLRGGQLPCSARGR